MSEPISKQVSEGTFNIVPGCDRTQQRWKGKVFVSMETSVDERLREKVLPGFA